jgi:hypothetical protein
MITNAIAKQKKEDIESKANYIALKNIKGESVISLKRFDTNTWILNPGTKNEEIVKIVLEENIID